MAYVEALPTSCRTDLLAAGNAAHDIRSILSPHVVDFLPELQVIDNIAGEVEGICRKMMGLVHIGGDPKGPLRVAIRKERLMSKLLVSLDEYTPPLARAACEEVLTLCNEQVRPRLAAFDTMLIHAFQSFCSDTAEEPQTQTPPADLPIDFGDVLARKPDLPPKAMKDDSPMELQARLLALAQWGKYAGELSHQCQNLVAVRASVEGCAKAAAVVDQTAGKAENVGRALMRVSTAQSRKGHATLSAQATKQLATQLENLRMYGDELVQAAAHPRLATECEAITSMALALMSVRDVCAVAVS